MTDWVEEVGVFTFQDCTNLILSLAPWPLYSGHNLLAVGGTWRRQADFLVCTVC